jgi:hypothetical protein
MYHLYQYDTIHFQYLRSFLDDIAYYDSGIGAGVRAYVEAIWGGLIQRMNAKEGHRKMPSIDEIVSGDR